jgi:long-chain acyl-CoA synthetase
VTTSDQPTRATLPYAAQGRPESGEQWTERYRGAVMNTFGDPQRVLVRGEGSTVWDVDGNHYLDLLAGIAVNALGHAHPAVVQAVTEQLGTLGHVSNFFTTEPQVRLAERLAPVRLVLSGSAPLDADQVAAFHEATGIVVHQGYGLTEAAPVVTSTLCIAPADDGEEAGPVPAQPDPASVGTALPGIEIRLVDDHGHTPLQGDPGQVSIRGANLFSGYWPDGDDAPDEDGWWATGDVGFLAPDGQLFLVDRVKELVIVSGFSVYPTEIEDVIEEVPGVREVAVIGVPDEDTGEAVVAYVVAPDQDPETVEAAVRARCVVRLARFKQPRRIEVVDALPHTVTGKVRKGSLRAAERRRHLELL